MIASVLLVLMWFALRRLTTGDTTTREILAAAALVGVIVIAGLTVPKIGDPTAAERTRDAVREIRDLNARGARLAEEQLREQRRVVQALEELRRTLEDQR